MATEKISDEFGFAEMLTSGISFYHIIRAITIPIASR